MPTVRTPVVLVKKVQSGISGQSGAASRFLGLSFPTLRSAFWTPTTSIMGRYSGHKTTATARPIDLVMKSTAQNAVLNRTPFKA